MLSASSLGTLSTGSARAQDGACAGVQVYPSQDLTKVANDSRAGTTFCVHDGTYEVPGEVRAQDGDRFVGLYDDSSRPSVTTTRALNVFNANGASDVLVRGLKISGAVGGNWCEPNCGRGIYGGDHLTVEDAWLTNNANQGIGGAGPVVVVRDSLVERNGGPSFGRDGGPITTAGIKASKDSLTVLNSTVRDNYWNGVWCDNSCEAFQVKGSTLTGNGKAGVHAEISRGPTVVSGNTIKGNGTLTGADHRVGLLVVSSSNVDAYANVFGGNVEHGVEVENDGRSPGVSAVKIHDNTMNGDSLRGCALPGVTCANNPDVPESTPPTVASYSTYGTDVARTGYPVPAPSGVAAGDTLMNVCFTSQSASENLAEPAESGGWTQIARATANTSSQTGQIWWKIADSTDANLSSTNGTYTWKTPKLAHASCAMLRVTGASRASSIDASAIEGSPTTSTSIKAPSVDPAYPDDLVVAAWMAPVGDKAQFDLPSGVTGVLDTNAASSSKRMRIATFASPGAFPTPHKTATLGPARYNVGAQVAVRGGQ